MRQTRLLSLMTSEAAEKQRLEQRQQGRNGGARGAGGQSPHDTVARPGLASCTRLNGIPAL